MKCFLILLTASLTASEKLDRTYLPPPGAQFAGGNPGDILAPLETPNLPQTGLRPANSIPNKFNGFEPTGQPAQLPVTTTSYAFSQTTTFPSIESFEATRLPINPIIGLPIQNVGPFNNLQQAQPGSLDLKQGEILISGSFPKQSISDQLISGAGSVKYPGQQGQLVNKNLNQYSGIDSINAGPIFRTTEAATQVQEINQYPSEQHSLNPQGPSTISAQANIVPNNQNHDIQNQRESPEYILPDILSSTISLDIMQPYLNQDYENEGTAISGSTLQQPFSPENHNTLNPGSMIEINNYQPGQVHDEAFSIPASKIHSGSHANRPSRPQAAGDRSAVILKYDNTRTPNGYSYSFETSNGIRADESGTVGDGTKAQGSYSYLGDDGKVYSVFYTADENGFQPHGDHLPTSPPIPDAIREVIEQAARDEAAGIFDDGSYDENKYGFKNHYLPENQREIQRNKLERKKIKPPSDKNESQQFYKTSDISDTNILSENYPSSKINSNNVNEVNNNSGKSDVRGSYFSEPNKNEENSSYFKDENSAGRITDLKPYMLPISGEHTGQKNKPESRDRYPVKTGGVKGITQSKSQYPESIISGTNKNLGSSYNGDDFGPVYDNDLISQDEQPKPGQVSPSSNRVFSEISNRGQNKYQTPITRESSEIFSNKYTNGNTPQAGPVFSRINVKDFDSKRIDTPSFTDYSQSSNNQQPINREIITQISENGYYYNSPQNQFDHTEFTTRFKGEEGPAITEQPVNKSSTPKPFLTPEVHNQPSIRKEYRNDFSTTPQPFMNPRVITHKDDSNPDYDNDKDYIFDEDIDDKDLRTTTPGVITDSSTRRPNQPPQAVTPSYKQTSSIPTPSQSSKFGDTETPSKITQQSQQPNSVTSISSNNRNTQISNYKYPTARPAYDFDETIAPNYSSNLVNPSLTNHIPTESKESRFGPMPTAITTVLNTSEYQPRFETSLPSGKVEAHQFTPTTSENQNQPVGSVYTPRPQIPERFDFESIPSYHQNINVQRPIDYSGTKKTPSKLDKPGIFILSKPGTSTPKSSPVRGPQSFTTSNFANTILSSTPSNLFSTINANSQISQTLPPTYQYRPSKPLSLTTVSPSTIGTSPNLFIPSTQPSLLPEVYSTNSQHPAYFSSPDIYHQNPIVDSFGKPIIPELRSVFSTPSQDSTPNVGIQFPVENYFTKPEESLNGSNNLPSGDEGRQIFNIEQSPTYPEYNNPIKVIGEDFSGPKQSQRYDAQTGYHYK